MKSLVLNASSSHLLIVDVQERLLPAMEDPEGVIGNSEILLRAAKVLGVPTTISEQYPKGLGRTVARICEHAEEKDTFAKLAFSCFGDDALSARLSNADRTLIVAGVEAHVCVLQTALDGVARGLNVFVVADATSSRRSYSKQIALDRLARAGVTVVTTEMVVFEWLSAASSPDFKQLSQLVR